MVADADATIQVYQRGGDANKPAAMIIHPPGGCIHPGGFCIPAQPVTRTSRVTAGLHTGHRLGAHRWGRYGQDWPSRCKKRPGWRPDGRETVTAAPIYHKLRRMTAPDGAGFYAHGGRGQYAADSAMRDGATDATAAA